ncbi:SDR family NAD(P)-dependent oxidoreductase [Herbidospora mongoliensis]|uniref:SDR family NAD(P)-dependent oxidoreductase n=1 Tax=Herbidospora mongoliensis TaxID=688067 RepID=UPI000AD5286F|nr:SDR family NAD(P)-dependent oxidoreductase [Herbidospora mongoliensis]
MSGAVIIGAGPGIGQAVARRFAREGLAITLIARSDKTLRAGAEAVAATGVPLLTLTADSTDERALRSALDEATDRHGLPDVVVYNAAIVRADRLGDLSVRDHLNSWAVNVVGAVLTAAHVLPAMAARGSGTFLITGGMPQPEPDHVSLSLSKAGVRALITLLDTQFGASGVHAASITVPGEVGPTGFDPDEIAEHYWRLHTQPRPNWDHEIIHAARSH